MEVARAYRDSMSTNPVIVKMIRDLSINPSHVLLQNFRLQKLADCSSHPYVFFACQFRCALPSKYTP